MILLEMLQVYAHCPPPKPVRPEPVERLPFLGDGPEQGKDFDKLSPNGVGLLRAKGRGYQTRINAILREAMTKEVG